MAAFVYAEDARCPQGHSLLFSLQMKRFVVDDEVCIWCKHVGRLQAERENEEKDQVPEWEQRARMWSVRPKL